MDGNVVTHERFGGDATQAALREMGVEVTSALTGEQMTEMGLREPSYGEATIGTCTDEEAALFYQMWRAQQELDDKTRVVVGDTIVKVGHTIRDSDRAKPLHEQVRSGAVGFDFATDDDAEEFFRLSQRVQVLHSMFHWRVGERLGRHRDRLGVRSRLRIVTVTSRY